MTTESKHETYEFGYTGNSYFQGSHGLVSRASDGASVEIRSDDRLMSVKVKDHRSYWNLSDLPEDVQAMHSAQHPDYPGVHRTYAINERTTRRNRRAIFLSSFDHQEARPLYFLCELPRGSKPASVDEAYELLKPTEVLAAEAQGLPVTRQGDVFAIACPELTTRDVKAMLRRGERVVKRRALVGTEHTASEVALCRDGLTLARGTMYHDVAFRQRDHARRRMHDGKCWHLIVRNTVPRQA